MTATAEPSRVVTQSASKGAEPALHVEGLWKIFGPKADKIIGTDEANLSRKELQEQTGHVVGCLLYTSDAADE